MLSRALSLGTLMLLAGCLAPERAAAQENLDAGKSPSQLFAGTCNACHKSPRGLLRSVPASSLSSFLRQHYTTSQAMAGVLATYLISNGATDTRLGGASPREGAREGAKGSPVSRPAAKPDEGQLPVQAAIDHGTDGHKLSAKQRLSKHGRPGAEEPPKAEETPSSEMPKEATGESKPEATVPAGEGASKSAKVEEPGEAPLTRVDPVPQVTPAPSAPATGPAPAAPVSSVVSAASSEAPAVPLPSKPTSPPPALTTAAPALPPVPPAGPPAPPISQ